MLRGGATEKTSDGHVEGLGRHYKITHTWMKVGDTWQIIGGMCGDLSGQAR